MAGLIKGQILKHLSKFTKNLSPDKINLSALKGEGDLTNLELDEIVLTELLALPTWLRLSKASCNRVTIKIQWTKLASQPIMLFMDEVTVEMETCVTLRTPTSSAAPSYSSGGKYGLAEQIVDGMCVTVNSVIVSFKSIAFAASIQISRVTVQSKTPLWQDGDQLGMTRLKNELIGEVMIFKEAEWQTLRIEANALSTGEPRLATTPLRLIANQSKIRIVIKKRLIDCAVIASRLEINLDDLLWVLTDSQLSAAMAFANSLRETIAKSTEQNKHLAAERLKKQGQTSSPTHQPTSPQHSSANPSSNTSITPQQQQPRSKPQHPPLPAVKQGSKTQQIKAMLFEKYNIRETSYHVYTGRIDLHLCDDAAPDVTGFQRKVEGGAIQLAFSKLEFDFYPLHRAGASRAKWVKYDDNMIARDQWASQLLDVFKKNVRTVRESFSHTSPSSSSNTIPPTSHPAAPIPSPGHQYTSNNTAHHNPSQHSTTLDASQPFRSFDGTAQTITHSNNNSASFPGASNHLPPPYMPARPPQLPLERSNNVPTNSVKSVTVPTTPGTPSRSTELVESCIVIRLEDFVLYRISSEHRTSGPRKFFASDKKTLLLPREMSSVHVEYTEYYFPAGKDYPVPNANLYIMVNPICLSVDYLTIAWLNAFSLNLAKNAEVFPKSPPSNVHIDIRLDALMPRVIIPSTDIDVDARMGPVDGLQIQMSKMTATNTRTDSNQSSRQDLAAMLDKFDKKSSLFSPSTHPITTAANCAFPNEPDDWSTLASRFHAHARHADFDAGINRHMTDVLYNIAPEHRSQALNSVAISTNHNMATSIKQPIADVDSSYYSLMRSDSLQSYADADVWCVVVEQLWLEFVPILRPASSVAHNQKTTPFVESFPVTLWCAQRPRHDVIPAAFCGVKPQLAEKSQTTINDNNSIQFSFHHFSQYEPDSQGGIESSTAGGGRVVGGERLRDTREYASMDAGVTGEGAQFSAGGTVRVVPSCSAPEILSGSDVGAGVKRGVGENGCFEWVPSDESSSCMLSGEAKDSGADVHLMVAAGTKVKVQLNHAQFCFLMNMIDTIKRYLDEIEADVLAITKVSAASIAASAKRAVVWASVDEVELALVFPYIPPVLPNSISSLLTSPDQEEDAEEEEEDEEKRMAKIGVNGREQAANIQQQQLQIYDDVKDFNPANIDIDHNEGPSLSELSIVDSSSTSLIFPQSQELITTFSQSSDSLPSQQAQLFLGSPYPSSDSETASVSSFEPMSSTREGIMTAFSSSHVSAGSDILATENRSSPSRELAVPSIGKKPGVVQSELKRSFNSFTDVAMSGLTKLTDRVVKPSAAAVTQRAGRFRDDSDIFDSVSIRSGLSDEDDEFDLVRLEGLSEQPAFERQPTGLGEDTGSLTEGGGGSEERESIVIPPADRLVTVLNVKLGQVEASVQAHGKDVSVLASVRNLLCTEISSQRLDRFQTTFVSESSKLQVSEGTKDNVICSSGCRETATVWNDDWRPMDPPIARIRFELGARAENLSPGAAEIGYLRAMLCNIKTSLGVTTLMNLGELLDDEKQPPSPIFPVDLEATNVQLTVIDDKLPVYGGPPKMAPIEVHVHKTVVRRDGRGVVHIAADNISDIALSTPSSILNFEDQLPRVISTSVQTDDSYWPTCSVIDSQSNWTATFPDDSAPTLNHMTDKLLELKRENDGLRRQLEKIGQLDGIGKGNVELENCALLEQLGRQADELLAMKQERESLWAMLQQLQDDLDASEKLRQRSSSFASPTQ